MYNNLSDKPEMGVWSNLLVCYIILRGSTPFCSRMMWKQPSSKTRGNI